MPPPRKPAPTPSAPSPRASLGTLGDLLRQKGFQTPEAPPAPAPEPAPAPSVPSPSEPSLPDLTRCAKVVVRRERKGRGGHVATVVSHTALDAPSLDALARALKHALGCGAHVEGDDVVLQGDQSDRAKRWLESHGARKVVLGS